MKTAALHNLGCKVNSYETDAMQQLLEGAGYRIVPFTEKADVYVINTCSVTNVADHKSRQMIHKARKMNPDAVVVAAGCYVQTADHIAEDPAVDIVIGNNRKNDLVRLLQEFGEKHQQPGEKDKADQVLNDRIDINDGRQDYEEMQVSHPMNHTRAFIKIQDGCNQFCSYCIIPFARGRIRSRDPESILQECSVLADQGFREIVLTGIHLSSYGLDNGSDLLTLLTRLEEVPGILRIRLGSLEPRIITEDFVRKISSLKKVCPHFHLSLQSGSDSVLKRMNRHYTAEEYLEKCELLRRFYEHPAITTDIIVGFPGETEQEFQETLDFAGRVGFYEIHVFKYSRRTGTAADRMKEQIPETVKQERSHVLMQKAQTMKQEFVSWYSGKKVSVLFEETREKDGCLRTSGYTPEYVKVSVPGEETLKGKIKIVEFSQNLY